jgi:ABC-type sugar transport system ATPase subunit
MIEVDNVSLRAGQFALDEVSLQVPTGKYGVLMGQTGSGKTTILEAICGLKSLHAGRVRLQGRDVTGLKPAQRGVAYLPQDLALFRTMTVAEHLAFALVIRKWPKREIERRVAELAERLGIAYLLHRKPLGLSGGESQRVALGRALSCHPQVLLLDEPLSALDDVTRLEIYQLLRAIQNESGLTALHVTHSQSEAAYLADKLFVLRDGAVQEEPLPQRAATADHGPTATIPG